jgi:hypothetical protein
MSQMSMKPLQIHMADGSLVAISADRNGIRAAFLTPHGMKPDALLLTGDEAEAIERALGKARAALRVQEARFTKDAKDA